jgi:hypothetical protein
MPRVAIALVVVLTAAPTHAANLGQPWSFIADPAKEKFVPASQDASFRADRRVRVTHNMTDVSRHSGMSVSERRDGRRYDIGFACRVALAVFMIMLSWSVLDEYVLQTRPIPAHMRLTAQEFVDAFARPLLIQRSTGPPIRWRLRYLPRREELEILIAPGPGRGYPNLSDHRGNVEYDVDRVLRALNNRLVLSGALRAERPWVVIPVRSTPTLSSA